jgi:oligopeptide/dipeptide ABC transporter ATP-binding protein
MSAAVVDVRDLNVTYPNGLRAVRDVQLSVDAGEVLAVVGESGSGKSTILRALLGVLAERTAVTGTIRVADVTVSGASERTLTRVRGKVVGFVPQNPFHSVDPLRRVGAHLRDAARCHGPTMSWDEVRNRLFAVGIPEPFADGRAYPHQWSGGMLQRACIAAALVHDPPVLLADEPTSALDRDVRDVVLDRIVSGGRATVIVTHDMSVAEAVANRVIVLYDGAIVEQGTLRAVVDAPRHPYSQLLWKATTIDVTDGALAGDDAPLRAASGEGCRFAPRCTIRCDASDRLPELIDDVRCHTPIGERP